MSVDLLHVTRKVLEWSCSVVLALYAVFFVYRAVVVVPYPYPVQFIEGTLYYQVVRFVNGGELYPDINAGPPFLGPVYAPVYPVLMSLIYQTVGSGYAWGRLVTFLSAVFSIALLALFVWQHTRKVGLAMLTAALLAGLGIVYKWGVFYRVDMLAIAFSMAGFWLIRTHAKPLHLALAAILFAAAFYTKQSFMAAPLAAGLFFLTERSLELKARLRLAGIIFGLWAVIVAAVFVWLNWATGGEFFLHAVVYKRQPWGWERWISYASDLCRFHWPLLTVAVWSAWQARHDTAVRSWVLFGGLSTVGMLFMIGLVGADGNYYLEPLMISAALFSIGLGRAWQQVNVRLVLFAALLTQLILVRHVPQWTDYAVTPTPGVRNWDESIVAKVQAQEGLVLADDVGWVVAGNGSPVVDDPILFADLSRQGVWNDQPLASLLEKRQVAAIITYVDFARDNCGSKDVMYSPRVCTAVRSHYCLAETIGRLNVYKPNDRSGCK